MTTPAQVAQSVLDKGNELYRVLRVTTACTCSYNVPYSDSAVQRERTKQCQRCKALDNWEKLFDGYTFVD